MYITSPLLKSMCGQQDDSIQALSQDAVLKASCLVIGPGLSRDAGMVRAACSILMKAVDKVLPTFLLASPAETLHMHKRTVKFVTSQPATNAGMAATK